MTQSNNLVSDSVWEGVSVANMARWQGSTGGNLQQANVSKVSYETHDLDVSSTAGAVSSSTGLVVGDVVFDALQTDSRWTKDASGYNFRHTLSSTVLAIGGHTYRTEYKVTESSTGADVSKVVFRTFAKNSLLD